MNNKQKMKKIMTSKKSTKEIQDQLELMYKLRELRRDIEKAADKLCLKTSDATSELSRCLEDK